MTDPRSPGTTIPEHDELPVPATPTGVPDYRQGLLHGKIDVLAEVLVILNSLGMQPTAGAYAEAHRQIRAIYADAVRRADE